MAKNTSTEEYLIIADRHIEAAEQRIRRQKRRLFEMAGRGEDVSQKVQFLALLQQALRSMRSYRDGAARHGEEGAAADVEGGGADMKNGVTGRRSG